MKRSSYKLIANVNLTITAFRLEIVSYIDIIDIIIVLL